MLNCKLSGRTKSGSALTVGIVKAPCSGKPMPPLGVVKIALAIFPGDRIMEMGRDIFRCQVWLRPNSAALILSKAKLAALGYEQMSLFKLSFAQLFGYEQMNLFMLSLARKFRFQWLVDSGFNQCIIKSLKLKTQNSLLRCQVWLCSNSG